MTNLATGCWRALTALTAALIVLSIGIPGEPVGAFDEFPQESMTVSTVSRASSAIST